MFLWDRTRIAPVHHLRVPNRRLLKGTDTWKGIGLFRSVASKLQIVMEEVAVEEEGVESEGNDSTLATFHEMKTAQRRRRRWRRKRRRMKRRKFDFNSSYSSTF